MDHFMRSLKIFWRSERLLRENELRLITQKTMCHALAGLVAIFGLVMLSLAVFFALAPHMGQAFAALSVAGIDLLIAVALIAYAGRLKPPTEALMMKEMRDMAIGDMENELVKAETELLGLKKEAQRFLRNPFEAILPLAMGPLVDVVIKGMRSSSKKDVKTTSD
ncbi:MAG: hypothetical protein ACI8ZB_005451 [Desulforhopalus sp.]|jgi:hypothetical protein